jgi:hypothetical protein
MEIQGQQTINCSVPSCKHNVDGSYCSLKAIRVAPVSNVESGQDDESMCSSYEPRDDQKYENYLGNYFV